MRRLTIWLALVGAPMAVFAEDLPVPDDAFVYCTVCHGVQLMGNPIIKAPRLSGMAAWYTERQLLAFKNGWRGDHREDLVGMEMQPMAAALSEQQISDVAAFVSETRSPLPPVTVAGDAEAGRDLYLSCSACHGVTADGNESLGSPALTGLNDWYLVAQLEKFREGSRGSHPADTYGMQMRAATQLLSDDEKIRDVVSYISTLNNE